MHTFCRPFKILVHFQPQMREALTRLEEKWGGKVDDNPAAADEEDGKPEEEIASVNNSDLVDSKYALIHMRVYVKYMEEKVMPLYNMFRGPDPKPRKVRFTDLWYLFREGELVYSPVPHKKKKKRSADYGSTANNSTLQASYQSCWKVYSIVTPEVPSNPDSVEDKVRNDDDDDDDMATGADDDPFDDEQATKIWCYYIDFDGDSYRPVQRQFQIRRFEGEKDIKSLPVYPTKFLDDEGRFVSDQKGSGKTFKQYIEKKHLYHRGWTLTRSTTGAALDDVDKYPEHIESEVIVDFAEAYQTVTSWVPEFHNPGMGQIGSWRMDWCSDESLPTFKYTIHRSTCMHVCICLIRSDDVGMRRRNQAISDDAFLSAARKGDDATLSDEYLVLLPKRLMVFSFLQRKFINADINCLKVIEPEPDIFDKLSINEAHKQMVRSLVKEHFRKKKRRHEGKEVMYQDIIKGKGTGLVFLLHGVPGVGKTATAEAVAQENRKPLFSITCGDLGFKPGDVERNLTRIFRLANLWDCILLLDEADVFFTKRMPTDLERNALVTVFLRILEYYSGILFLTTNRVGIIDEAFKSRIHMSLYYPPLNSEQYRQIFLLNIKRTEEIETANEAHGERRVAVDSGSILQWSEKHFRETNNEVGRWNGRQIKNAFQISASLAHYDLLDTSTGDIQPSSTPSPGGGAGIGNVGTKPPRNIRGSKPGILDAAQFEAVAQATLEFDEYMSHTKKGTDSVLAKRDGTRNDPRLAAGVPTAAATGLHLHEHHHREVPPHQSTPTRAGGGAAYSQGRPAYAPPPRDGYRDTYYNDPFYSPEPSRRVPPADDQYYGQSPQPRQVPSLQGHEAGIPLEYGRRSYPPDDRHGGDGYERDMRGDGMGGGVSGGGIPPQQLRLDDGAGNVYGRGTGTYGQPPPDSNYRAPPDARY
ncbi:Protein CdcH [Lasiodiplodia hormozganensis]|uniref:Protein CdcH n=1 Tax=Lasiodiplodia hormozganensis TaxID=869390 RepID=A0AA39XQD9_9PEZI|nr:Protein CdcH [Lasiodiplodia hormozganensis]